MKRKPRLSYVEKLENRQLLAGDCLGDGFGDISIETDNPVSYRQVGKTVFVDGDETNNTVTIDGKKKKLNFHSTRTTTVSTGFENLTPDRSDLVNFMIGNEKVEAIITGIAGTRGVPPAYDNGAFALGIGQNVTIEFTAPVDAQISAREIIEVTPDASGTITFIGTEGMVTVNVTSNGANPPQSGDWDRFDSRDYGIGQVTRIEMVTSGGITNLDNLSFTHTEVETTTFNKVKLIYMKMGDGDDTVLSTAKVDSVMFGEGGNDFLSGGRKKDKLFGGAGDDLLFGNNGRDVVFGGEGNDVVSGGRGRDFVFGGPGDDTVEGGRHCNRDRWFRWFCHWR